MAGLNILKIESQIAAARSELDLAAMIIGPSQREHVDNANRILKKISSEIEGARVVPKSKLCPADKKRSNAQIKSTKKNLVELQREEQRQIKKGVWARLFEKLGWK